MSTLIDIDGSEGEGGVQMLRTSLALSLITGQPFRLRNVRARRAKPGLAAQHLMSVQAAAKIGNAKLRGAQLGSTDLTFEPTRLKPGDYDFTIGTAGATGLVLHTIYLPLALAKSPSSVAIEGGTHVKTSPCYHFLDRAWNAYLKALGIDIDLSLVRLGFYPRGGGRIEARIMPAARIQPFHGMTTPAIPQVEIIAGSAGMPEHVAERMIARATERLTAIGLDVTVHRESWHGGPGCMLGLQFPTAPAPTFFFSLGERGKRAEAVADEAVAQAEAFLLADTPAVDEHSADQLLLPLALADGPSEFRVASVSSHLLTNADVIRRFVDRGIECTGLPGEPGVVKVG